MPTLTANGTTEIDWPRGARGVFEGSGTFDGGTLKLEKQMEGDWHDVVDKDGAALSSTTNIAAEFVTYSNKLRVNLAGAGGSADINYHANVIEEQT